jgi:hypothetical protein
MDGKLASLLIANIVFFLTLAISSYTTVAIGHDMTRNRWVIVPFWIDNHRLARLSSYVWL